MEAYQGISNLVNEITPKVSVCVTTFNHVSFIEECLNSILNQKTEFPFEIILGEDNSTDGTREICKEYADKYPDKIRLYLREEKDKIFIDGRKTGRYNFIQNIKEARGEYVALCDGDDFWSSDQKLQLQFDMARNQDLVGLYSSYNVLVNGSLQLKTFSDSLPLESIIKPESVNRSQFHIGHTSTCFFRQDLVKIIVEHPLIKLSFGVDELILLEIFTNGNLGYLNMPLSSYRVNPKGVTGWERAFDKRCLTYQRKYSNFTAYLSMYPFYKTPINFKRHFFAIHLTNCRNFSLLRSLSAICYFIVRGDYNLIKKGLNGLKKRLFNDQSL